MNNSLLSEKSEVIYFPDSIIENPSTLTSLCLFHDEVILFFTKDPYLQLKELKRKYYRYHEIPSVQFHNYISFIQGPLKLLSEATLLTAISPDMFDKRFSNANNLEVSYQLLQNISDSINESKPRKSKYITVGELLRSIMAYSAALKYDLPLVTDKLFLPANSIKHTKQEIGLLADILSRSAIANLALPDLRAQHPEDIILAKRELKDELIEYRAGILSLTYMLRQNISSKANLLEISNEADILVNTRIKAALLNLEFKIAKHNNTRLKRMLFGTAKVGLELVKLFLPSSIPDKIITGSKSLFELATAIDDNKVPEIQMASFLYGVRNIYQNK